MIGRALEAFATRVTRWCGSNGAFIGAVMLIVAWAATGPLFDFGEGWQLVVNTGTTVVNFLLAFLVLRGQNKGDLALHLKLDEVLAALKGASSRLINVEELTEEQLEELRAAYDKLRQTCGTESHTVDEVTEVSRLSPPYPGKRCKVCGDVGGHSVENNWHRFDAEE